MARFHLSVQKTERSIVDRLLDWHEQAKLAGRQARADELLLLAWAAYDDRPNTRHFSAKFEIAPYEEAEMCHPLAATGSGGSRYADSGFD